MLWLWELPVAAVEPLWDLCRARQPQSRPRFEAAVVRFGCLQSDVKFGHFPTGTTLALTGSLPDVTHYNPIASYGLTQETALTVGGALLTPATTL